ncbi:hypothetical protein BGZ76_003013 [Entomortierella beljakovae]|nr:hypothetical protein BGZ76_003013 [Entomortierella beljakovae]
MYTFEVPGVTTSASDIQTTPTAGTETSTTTGHVTTDTTSTPTITTTTSTTVDTTATTTTTTIPITTPTSTSTLPSASTSPATSHTTRTSNPVNPTKTPNPSPSKGGSKTSGDSTTTETTTPSGIAAGDSSSSSSNRTAITVGVVIGAIVVAGGIAVWIFRKAKLSPSNQFKTKIKNSDLSISDSPRVGETEVYDNYTDIFRPPDHTGERPMTATSMAQGAHVSAAAAERTSPGSRPSPSSHHEEYQYQDYEDYQDYPYDNQYQQQQHQQHQQQQMNASGGTVPDYSQYRWHGGPTAMTSAGNGYESGVHDAVLGVNSTQGNYGYQDYGSPHDRFLRELRE